jgi:hypothetical protein
LKEGVLGHEKDLAFGHEEGESEVEIGAVDGRDQHRSRQGDVLATADGRTKKEPGETAHNHPNEPVEDGLLGI